jgi:GR25 family glycosyltransferase involved in LPS biosynthesis
MSTSPLDIFWNIVDGVLVINLDSRPDRWQTTLSLTSDFIPAGKLQRLPATKGTAIPGFGTAPWFRGRRRDKTWAGRAGCTLSHRGAIDHAKKKGWRTLMILEDDIELSPDLVTVLSALPAALKNHHWDVCYLGFTSPVPPYRTLAELHGKYELCQLFGCNTAHAYLLRDTTYDWLLEQLPQTDNIWCWISQHRAIDRWYYRNLSRRYTVCAVSPSVISQQEGFSNITQRQHKKNHISKIPARRSSVLAFRLLGTLRSLGFRLAEPRDWLRGKIKRVWGF